MAEPARVLEFKQKKGFGDMLKKTATVKQPAKTKTKMPVLDPPKEVKGAVDQYIEAKNNETMAKAEKEAAGAIVMDFTSGVQDGDGYKGNFRNSYAVPGTKPGNQVKYVSSNRFSINADDADEIKSMLDDLYDEMIQEDYVVKLKPEVFENEELQDELMELIGDRFEAFFDNVVTLKVKENFNGRIYQAVEAGEELEQLRTFCKPYKPALK